MTRLLRIDTSIRGEGSVTRALADTFQKAWTAQNPAGEVVTRDLATDPLPYVTPAEVGAGFVPAEQRSPEQQAAAGRAAEVYDDLLAAEVVLISVPLYNWSIPATLKSWIDTLFLDPRPMATPQPLAGRRAVLVNAHGGSYAPGTPRDGWNHAEPYLRTVLEKHLGLELQVITAEFTLAEINPALAQFKEHGAKSLAEAHQEAERIAS